MSFLESLKMAIESIKANKMRSFLTMLGIIIGISSVITIISLGQGGQNQITGEFEKIGASTVNVTIDASKAENNDYFNLNDVKQIENRIPSVKYASPVVQKRGSVSTNNKTKTAVIEGINSEYADISDVEMVDGRFINERDMEDGRSVAIIDENGAKAIFGTSDAVGKSMQLTAATSSKKVMIIGVSKSSGMFGGGFNIPAIIYTPVSFMQSLYSSDFQIDTITITADSQNDAESAGNSAVSILEARHNNRGKNVYKADNVFKQLDQINKILGIFTTFIGAVAAISLIVGGIGVMNIMLVSVTERTREIGIRKAIGADTEHILLQFLTESVIISLIGGVIGMLIGIGGAEIIGYYAGITPSLSPVIILGVILFSSSIGIFFGIYPARKAAKLDPIEALRYE